MSDGVAEVAAALDQEPSGDPDPGADHAGGTSPAEIEDAVGGAEPIEAESGTTTLWDHLTRAPSKSVHEADASEWFDPDAGGKDRLALVAEDVMGSEGVPNWLHLVVGAVEIVIEAQDDRADGELEDEPTEVVPA